MARADPVICGHSGEARNLAEAALLRGFTEVKIITWPISRLIESGLPLKPLDGVSPYSPGIEVERPEPVGDYKVPDGRYLAGLTGRLVELFTDGVPTVCMSLYLSPHTLAVVDAVRAAEGTGLPVRCDHRRGRGFRRDQRGALVRGGEPVRRGRPGPVGVPEQRLPGGGLGVHPAVDHQLGGGDRRPARHPVRRAVPGAGRDLLPRDQHRGVPRSRTRHGWPRCWPAGV